MSADTCEQIGTAMASFVTTLRRDTLASSTELQIQADAAPQPDPALFSKQPADTFIGHPVPATLGQTREAAETTAPDHHV